MNRRHPLSVLLLMLAAACVGCGPKVTLSPELQKEQPRVVAFLGVKAPDDMRKERVEYLEQALRSEISNRGYLVLDKDAMSKTCSSVDCPELSDLVNRNGLQGTFTAEISSITRANFGVGYWNSVSGKLRLLNPAGIELLAVDHSEREQGGVVFQSGQAIEAITSTVRNAGDDAFNMLADKYAKTIALKIPRVESSSNSARDEDPLKSVSAQQIRNGVYEICAVGAERAIVSLVVNKQRTNLRPTKGGTFCGIYRIEPARAAGGAAKLYVEARSPFGQLDRQDVALDTPSRCDLDGKVELRRDDRRNLLSVRCVALNSAKKKSAPSSCSDAASSCSAEKLIVYRAPTDQGPFTKVTELRDYSWSEPAKKDQVTYRVVAVDSRGDVSAPVTPLVTP